MLVDLVIVPASYYYFGGHATPTMLFLLRGNALLFRCVGGIRLASRQATLHSQHPGSSELVILPPYDPAIFFACLPPALFYGTRQNPLLVIWGVAAPVGLTMAILYVAWMMRNSRPLAS